MEGIDLSKPAFGPGAQKLSDLGQQPAETPQVEQAEASPAKPQSEPVEEAESVEEAAEQEESQDEPEEQKVPYSRFKKFHDMAKQSREEIAELRNQIEAFQESRQQEPQGERTDAPSWWTELYGDSDASLKAWRIQRQANEQLIAEAREQAIEAVRSAQEEESSRIRSNEGVIDQNFDSLSEHVGRDLSEKEKVAILDIVDEYTPKDEDGNYLGALIPFEKAWETYELRQQTRKAPRVQARDKVAELTGAPSQGEPESAKEEREKSWNPLDWSAYKKRLS